MNGIEKITGRILQEAKSESDSALRAATSEADGILQRYKASAKSEADAMLEAGRAQAEEREKRLSGVADLEARKLALQTKQAMLDEAFAAARGKLRALPTVDTVAFLARVAADAVVTGNETVTLSATDREAFGSELLKALGKVASEKGLRPNLRLSETAGAFDGGLVLSEGSVETNCTFDTLLRLARDELSGEVAALLFD